MSEAVTRYWVHRCRRGEVAQPGSPCAALLWQADELERLRAIAQRAREVRAEGMYGWAEAARHILGEEKS